MTPDASPPATTVTWASVPVTNLIFDTSAVHHLPPRTTSSVDDRAHVTQMEEMKMATAAAIAQSPWLHPRLQLNRLRVAGLKQRLTVELLRTEAAEARAASLLHDARKRHHIGITGSADYREPLAQRP